ncbi:hypothetical protein ACEPAG_9189 [Sanghuangporus baumii]
MASQVRQRSNSNSNSNNNNNSSDSDGEVMEVDGGGVAEVPAGLISRTASGQAEPPDSMEEEEEEKDKQAREAEKALAARLDAAAEAVVAWIHRALDDEGPSGDELQELLGNLAAVFPTLSDEERAEQPAIYGVGKWLSNRATLVNKAEVDAKAAAEALREGLKFEVERLCWVRGKVTERRAMQDLEDAKRREVEAEEKVRVEFLKGLATARALNLVPAYCEKHGRDEQGNRVAVPAAPTKQVVRPCPAHKGVASGAAASGGASTPALDAGESSSETPKARRRLVRGGRSAMLTGKTMGPVELEVSDVDFPREVTPPTKGRVRVEVPAVAKREREAVPERAPKRARASASAPSVVSKVQAERGRRAAGQRKELVEVGALPEGQSWRLVEIVLPGDLPVVQAGAQAVLLPSECGRERLGAGDGAVEREGGGVGGGVGGVGGGWGEVGKGPGQAPYVGGEPSDANGDGSRSWSWVGEIHKHKKNKK